MNKEKDKLKLIKLYCEIKKTNNLVLKKIGRHDFHKASGYTRHAVEKLFGTYGNFVELAEIEFRNSLSEPHKALLSERSKKFDMHATKEDCMNDLRHLQEKNDGTFITRNKYRINGTYSDSTWNRFFGSFSEFRKQAGLELSRHQQRLERDIAKHAAHDFLREYYVKEIQPYFKKYEKPESKSRYKTMLIGSDFHDIDTDEFVNSVFIDTAKRLQPDVIVLNGDIFDLYDASKYDKDIRELKIVERFDYVKKNIFKPLRDACPDAQIDFILGNHEWRLILLLAAKTPNIRVILSDVMGLSLADVFGLDKFKINLISKIDLAAYNKNDINNELRKNYRVYYGCFVVGHFKDIGFGVSGTSGHCHRPSTETFTNITMGKCFWVETGCMCVTDAEYVMHRDKWGQSFLIAHIDTIEKKVNPEHIIIGSNSVVVHGVRYTRKK